MTTRQISQEARQELLELLEALEAEIVQDWKDSTGPDVQADLHAQATVIIRLKDEVSNEPESNESDTQESST